MTDSYTGFPLTGANTTALRPAPKTPAAAETTWAQDRVDGVQSGTDWGQTEINRLKANWISFVTGLGGSLADGDDQWKNAVIAYVAAQIAAMTDVVDGAPALLDTLNELAAAIGDDPSFAATMTTALAGKAPLSHTQAISTIIGLQTALDEARVTTNRNLFLNSAMQVNQRKGNIREVGRYQILSHPYRWDSAAPAIRAPDGTWEVMAFSRGVTLDRWMVFLNDFGATGGAGYVEQVRCIDAPQWTTATAYIEGDLVVAPAGGYGDGYVYRCLSAHTSGSWATDVKTAIDPTSWEALPKYWAIYGIHETDPALQNKFALHWVMSSGSSAAVRIEQRILGIDWVEAGDYVLSFLAKDRNGGAVPVRGSVVQEFGVGASDHTDTSTAQNVTGTASVQQHTLTLADPSTTPATGYDGNNRLESVHVKIEFTTVGQVFDLLITDIQFAREYTPLRPLSYADDLDMCLAYYQTYQPSYVPARFASYVADYANTGGAQYNVLAVDQLWDLYGRIINDATSGAGTIYWGGTNRAYANNEREIANSGQLKVMVERQAKAHPGWGQLVFCRPMIRRPNVTFYDTIGGMRGYATANNRFKASLKWSYTGSGASARAFAQRALVKLADFSTTETLTSVNTQNVDPASFWEDFSVSVTIPAGQDVLGTAFLSLFPGYKYDWDWVASASGTNVYYLVAANTQYYKLGAGSLLTINDWATATTYAVGDVVRIAGTYRLYECVTAHTSGGTAPTDTDINWRPYGRISMPYQVQFDGVTSSRSNIANPATLGGLQWFFGDNDSLGFETVYVRMNIAPVDPGSSAGRLKLQSYDQQCDLYEILLTRIELDAEIYSL